MDIVYLHQGPKFAMGLLQTLQQCNLSTQLTHSMYNEMFDSPFKCNYVLFHSMFCNVITRQQAKSSLASKAPTNSKATVYWFSTKKNEKNTSFPPVFSLFNTPTRGKKIVFNVVKKLKNLFEKEEETHNIVMAKYT